MGKTAPPMRALGLAALLLAAPAASRAQASTQDQINQAVALYEQFNVEAARPILLKIISPGYLQQVSSEQKAAAFKYLGASYAVLASPDSARSFFIAALDFDPFTDLDPTKFAGSELGAFNDAKAQIFKIGIKPMIGPSLIVPQSQSDTAAFVFRLITTQRATLRVDLVNSDSTVREVLYDGPSDGSRGIPWRGILSTGRFAPPGIYTLTARATRSTGPTGGQPTTEFMNFRIEHIFEPLEDTLPALDTLRQLLRERIPSSAPWYDLVKGGVLAAAAVGIPLLALNKDAKDLAWTTHAGAAAGVGLISAGISFYYRRNNPEIDANVKENARRRAARAAFNTGVRARNQARSDRTLLVISPVAGFSQ